MAAYYFCVVYDSHQITLKKSRFRYCRSQPGFWAWTRAKLAWHVACPLAISVLRANSCADFSPPRQFHSSVPTWHGHYNDKEDSIINNSFRIIFISRNCNELCNDLRSVPNLGMMNDDRSR